MTATMELMVGYFSLIPEMRGVAPIARRALGEVEGEADRAGSRSGDTLAGSLGKSMMVGVAGLGVAAGGLIAKGLSDAMEAETITDKLAAGLGATGDQAKSYGSIAGRIYAQAYGENLGEVSTAIDSVASSLKGVGGVALDDGSIERLTKKSLDFASIYGTDVAEQVQLVNQLVGNGLASSADEGFDMLAASFQKVPAAMRGELPEILSEYGTNFRALGFEGEDAFNLLINAAGQGKFVLDKTGDALKEFTIRGSDMSKASSEAYGAIKLDAVEMSKAIAAGGEGAQKALQQTAQGLLAMENPAERANTAIALFGTPLEDLSIDQIPAFLSSLAGAPDAMGDFAGAMDQAGATLADNASTRIESFKRTVSQGLTNFAGGVVLPALTTGFGAVSGFLSPVVSEVQGGVTAFVAAFREGGDEVTSSGFAGFLEGLGLTANKIFGEIKGGVTAFVAAFKDGGDEVTSSGFAGFLEMLGVQARNLYDTWNSTIKPALSTVAGIAMDLGSVVLPILWGAFTTGVGVIGDIIDRVSAIVGWLTEHKDVAVALGAVLATALLPTLIATGIRLAVTGAAWVANTVAINAYLVAVRFFSTVAKIAAAGQWLLNAALNANPISLIIIAIVALVAAIVLAYRNSETFRNIVQSVWEAIQTAISFAWNSIIKPVFEALKAALGAVGDFFSWVWNSVIKPAWSALSDGIAWYWNNVISPAWDALKAALGAVGDFFNWVWNSVIKPAWEALGNGIAWVWQNVILPNWEALKAALNAVGDLFSWVWNSVIKPAWDALGDGIAWVWNNVISPAWEALKSGLQAVRDSFSSAVEFIGKVWDGIKAIVAKPVRFVVETVYNNGIRAAWNKVAGWLNLPELPEASLGDLGNYKTGGVLPGYSPGRDIHQFTSPTGGTLNLSGGEAVMIPQFTNAVGGPAGVASLNSAARSGPGAVRKQLEANFAFGGVIDESLWNAAHTAFPNATLNSAYRPGHSGYHGKGQAVDLGGPMQQIADWIYRTYPDSAQLIWGPGPLLYNVGGNKITDQGQLANSVYAGDLPGHFDHVHWASDGPITSDGQMVSDEGASSGGGSGVVGTVMNFLRNRVADGFDAIMKPIGDAIPSFGDSTIGRLPKTVFDYMTGKVRGFLTGEADKQQPSSSGGGMADWIPSAGAEQWRQMMIDAYINQGYEPLPNKIDAWVRQIDTESHGDPNISQQIVDINGTGDAAGVGLGQMIPGTWASYRDPALPDNRRDPWAMTNAMVRYGEQKYGPSLLDVIGHGHGYDQGGIFRNNTIGWNTSGKPEAVLTNEQWDLFKQFNDVLAEVGPAFIEKMSDIVPKAGLEILGLDGTLLDPDSNRYYKAGMEIAKTAQDFQAKKQQQGADPVSPEVNIDQSVNLINPVFQDQNQALRDAGNIQQRNMMRNAGRPFL